MRHQLIRETCTYEYDGATLEIPEEVLAAARLVYDWMRENLVTQLCGLEIKR